MLKLLLIFEAHTFNLLLEGESLALKRNRYFHTEVRYFEGYSFSYFLLETEYVNSQVLVRFRNTAIFPISKTFISEYFLSWIIFTSLSCPVFSSVDFEVVFILNTVSHEVLKRVPCTIKFWQQRGRMRPPRFC